MDRGLRNLLSWMLLPVPAVLVASALSLPRQPYTGLLLREDRVAWVAPGGPAARAGLARGDRLIAPGPFSGSPLASAAPGQPLALLRQRGEELAGVVLVPETLPRGERRTMAAMLAVACGFVVIGGWVWSERRDRLARTFFLLCLAFALLLAPFPRFGSAAMALAYGLLYSGVSVFLPALFVHFFALFPESERPGGLPGAVTRIAYGVATGLFLAALALALMPRATRVPAVAALAWLQGIAGLWFASGLAAALALFARSYFRARSADARRRLRVALAGAVLGVAPLATLVALHSLFHDAPLPGERWAVFLTLLVPASFAWAAAVHRVFEIRMALRAAAVVAVLALGGALVYFAGEWLAAVWRPDLGDGIAGGALAFCVLTASVAGPAGGWLHAAGERLVPAADDLTLAEWLDRHPWGRRDSSRQVMDSACEALASCLLLDGCAAIECGPGAPRAVATTGATGDPALEPGLGVRIAGLEGLIAVSDPRLDPADRRALELAGVSWILPLTEALPRVVLMLGRRLAGPWLSPREVRELERFASRLDVLLENASLREQATAHGEADRQLTRAGAIQARLLPRRIPADRALDCAAAALSCEPVGGDYYDFVRGPRRSFTLAVGDAAGKGVPAALMGVWAQACFRQQARRGADPGEVLSALNRELVAMDQPQAFVALLCARMEPREGRLWYASAGLPPPLLRRRDGRFEELSQSGVLLGVMPQAQYTDVCVDLEPGDATVLYTDGLSEARRGDELFGARRLAEVVAAHAAGSAAQILGALLAAVQAFADHPLDDITAVVLKQLGRPVGRPVLVRAVAGQSQIALKPGIRRADRTS